MNNDFKRNGGYYGIPKFKLTYSRTTVIYETILFNLMFV